MSIESVSEPVRSKPRILKQPAVRRAELIDCAQGLFLSKGYERTTINDVIDATGLSKGAFYHHFRAKEDLLEAIAERFARQAMTLVQAVADDPSLDPLRRLNGLLAMSREWKEEHLGELRAMFLTLLKPENARLYHRIVGAVFGAMAPTVAGVIAAGQAEGVFDCADADVAAEALLWMSESRRLLVVQAMSAAEAGDVDGAVALIMKRLRAEEAMIDRILGLAPGSVDLAGSQVYIRTLIVGWVRAAGRT
ncbi:MAG TPA: TetR/AcrR family transcriptional regulator [Caulobacteraceae bacterium]|nr:TetR/AcrR family transcriptional regulator [Caulobacteraceae bacterium]